METWDVRPPLRRRWELDRRLSEAPRYVNATIVRDHRIDRIGEYQKIID